MRIESSQHLRRLGLVVAAALALTLIVYLIMVKRVTTRMPSVIDQNGNKNTVILAIPVFRWATAETDPRLRKILGPLIRLDQTYVRQNFWKAKLEVVRANLTEAQARSQESQNDNAPGRPNP